MAAAEEKVQRLLEWKILAYLSAHPDAKDTRDGIRAWWLQDTGDVSQPALQAALDNLANRGWLEVRGTGKDECFYGLSSRHRSAVAQFLEKES